MDIFLKNSKFLLKKNENSIILCAYTCGDIVIKNGWNVQKAILNNGLYIESITPKFHTYNSAQSLGYCADLYVLRLTNVAYKEPIKLPNQWNIYTHGNMALESNIDNSNHFNETLSLTPCKNGFALMEILRNGINFCQFQKFEKLYFEHTSLFSYNLLQLLINLHSDIVFLIADFKQKDKLIRKFNYFFNIEENNNSNYNCKVTRNNDIGGILVQKSFMKLESVLIKHVSLLLNKTKNQMRSAIENSKLIYKYKDFQIGSIPLNILIKIIDILKQDGVKGE